MRVLHVIQSLSRNFGGPATALSELVDAQSKAGLDVDVMTTNVDPAGGVISAPPDRFVAFSGGRARYSSLEWRAPLLSFDFARIVTRDIRNYDVVHVHGLYRLPPAFAAWRARSAGIPYIIQPHGSLDPYTYARSTAGSVRLKRLYEGLFALPNLRAADAIHYTSDEERDRASFLGLRTPAFVVPMGLDWARYETLPVSGGMRTTWELEGKPIVLFVGRLHFAKGLDVLIPAFDAVRREVPDARLVIAGPDNDGYGDEVRRWVRERGLEPVVRLCGPLDAEAVLQAYTSADVFVMPSYAEGFGMAVLEAMACGRPVVISDQVNIHAPVAHAGAGLVTRSDAGELAAALTGLLRDVARARAMGDAGRRLVQAHYTWPAIVELLSSEYAATIERRRKRVDVPVPDTPLARK